MARLHPGDAPVQGPEAGRPSRGAATFELPGPWDPAKAVWTAKSPPPPGSRLRSVRDEVIGMVTGALLLSAACVVAACFDPPPDVLGAASSFAGAVVAISLVLTLKPKYLRRHVSPQPWPSGVTVESTRQSVVATVALFVCSVVAVLVVLELTAGELPEILAIWAGMYLALGIAWTVDLARIKRVERALGASLFRDPGSLRRRRWSSRQAYARPDRS